MAKTTKKDQLPTIRRGGQLFDSFARLQDRIRHRAFEIFQDRAAFEGNPITDWLQAESEVLTSIALNFVEEDDQYILRGEVPGFTADEVDIQIEDHTLTVGGSHSESKRKAKGKQTSSEVCFMRRMMLPADADADRIDASLKDGVLEVLLPKTHASN